MRRVPSELALAAWAPLVAGVAVGIIEALCRALACQGCVGTNRRQKALQQLCQSIPGNDKAALAAVLGPPQASAGFAAISPALPVNADYVHADVWYYPLDAEARSALAVRFEAGVAREVRLFQLK